MTETIQTTDKVSKIHESLNHHWKALLVFALITIGAGIACLISPNMASLAIDRVLAVGLLLSAIPLALIACQARVPVNRLVAAVAFLVSVVIGGFLFLQPESGVIVITLAMAAWFVLHGIYKLILSFKLTDFYDRGMATLSGLINIAAAVLIFKFSEDSANNPEALAAGVGLIFSGIVWIRLAWRHRNPQLS